MTVSKTAVSALHDRAIYLVLSWSFLGTWKGVETNDTSSEVRASKRIIQSVAVQQMRTLRNKVRRILGKYSLNSLFRPGVYCIPLEYIDEIETALKEAAVGIDDVRQTLKGEWSGIISDAKERLGELFDEADYPNVDAAMNEFVLSYRYVPIADTPAILKSVAAEAYKEDLERSKIEGANELEAFRSHLRGTLLQIIVNMRKTLTKPDGERRVFGKRFFKNLNEFMSTFNGKNLSEDGELEKVVTQLATVAKGYDPDDLKDDEHLQKKLNTNLAKIDKSLKAMVADDGQGGNVRMINLSMASSS
jgi:hypothetical protein